LGDLSYPILGWSILSGFAAPSKFLEIPWVFLREIHLLGGGLIDLVGGLEQPFYGG